MKDSFIFYKSFMDAIETIPQIKYRYFLLESIIKVGLFSEESLEKLETFCIEIEQKLGKNSQVLGMFFAIKPQLIANYKKYLNGQKGKQYGTLGGEFGALGGRPKKPPKNPPNVNVNVLNVNDNVLNEGGGIKEKKIDPYINPIKTLFQNEYQKIMGNTPRLSSLECNRLIELSAENPDIKEIIPLAIKRLKAIDFKDIQFTPSASWLLKGNNFERVINGEFEPKKDTKDAIFERLRQKYEKKEENNETMGIY